MTTQGKITDDLIRRAKETPFEEVAVRLGIQFSESGFALCPFHQDGRPSLHLWEGANRGKCFACGWKGDPIALVQETQRISFRDAIIFITGTAVGTEPTQCERRRVPDKEVSKWPPSEKTREIWASFDDITRKPENSIPAWRYLKGRGIPGTDCLRFKIGGVQEPGKVLSDLLSSGFSQDELLAAGIIGLSKKTGRRHLSFYAPSVVFAHRDFAGEICGFSGRFIPPEPEGAGRFVKLKGYPGFPWIGGFGSAPDNSGIAITEGIIDAISLSILCGLPVIAAGGGSCPISPETIQAAAVSGKTLKFWLAADEDEAGNTANSLWGKEISAAIKGAQTRVLSPRKYCEIKGLDPTLIKDWNDALALSLQEKRETGVILPGYSGPPSPPLQKPLDILSSIVFPSSPPPVDDDELRQMFLDIPVEKLEGNMRDPLFSEMDDMVRTGKSWEDVAKIVETQLPQIENQETRVAVAWYVLCRNIPLYGARI